MKFVKIALISSIFFASSVFAESMRASDYYNTIWNGMNYYSSGKYEQSFEIFDKMSKWGDKNSQYLLGNMYLMGQHTKQNIVEGAAWIIVAGEAKDEWAEHGEEIMQVLTAEEKQKVNQLVKAYIEEYGMKAQKISCRMEAKPGSRIKQFSCRKQKGFNNGRNQIN